MTVTLFPPTGVGGVTPSDPSTWPGTGWAGRWAGVMSPAVAQAIPGIARGVSLIVGQAMQMPMDDYRGVTPLPRPRLLDEPMPGESRAWFVGVQWEDWLLNGNALHVITSRGADGLPASAAWVPAAWCSITTDPDGRFPRYWVAGVEVFDVVHVKRGADRNAPVRGVGVVEQHLDALGVVRDQHRYESDVLSGAAVPSVAVIAPNPRVGQAEADAAKVEWVGKYGGPSREPAILPAGTQVIPLSWSPSDSQLVEARKLSLTDTANMLNLDGYWLGAETSSHTYRSPGPMYLNLIRQTVGPIAEVFEDVWSSVWLPRGRRVRFDRRAVLADDMATMVGTAATAWQAGLWSREEARVYLGMAPEMTGEPVSVTSPAASEPLPTPTTDDEPEEP